MVWGVALGLVMGWAAGIRADELAVSEGPSLFRLVLDHPERLEEALRVSFSRLLGNPSRLDLVVERGSRVEQLGGRFRRISVRFEDGALDTLRVSRAQLEAVDVHFDLEKLLSGEDFMPRSVGSTHLDLMIEESALNDTILASRRQLGVSDPYFEILEGEIRFRGGIRLVFFDNRIDLAGQLLVRNGSELHFRPSHLHVSRVRVPGFLVQAISRKFNPVVRLSRAPFWDAFRVHLGEISMEPGKMRVVTEVPPRAWEPSLPSPQPVVAQGESKGTSVVPFEAL